MKRRGKVMMKRRGKVMMKRRGGDEEKTQMALVHTHLKSLTTSFVFPK